METATFLVWLASLWLYAGAAVATAFLIFGIGRVDDSARGAYMQMGALIGTIMAANVLMIIIPNQRVVAADLIAGRAPDPKYGKIAKTRRH